MLHDLLNVKQVSPTAPFSSSFSNSSKKLVITQHDNIFVLNFKNGIVKRESVKMVDKSEYIDEYKLGEPKATVYPVPRVYPNTKTPDDTHLLKSCISNSFFPSLGGDFQMMVVNTRNHHMFLFKSPEITSTSTNYFWERLVSLSDIIHQVLTDPEANEPIEENDEIWLDRNINARYLVLQGELVSNLEYKKRYEWLDTQCMDWSPIMIDEDIYEGDINNNNSDEIPNISLLGIGTKCGIVLFKIVIPKKSDLFDDSFVSLLKLNKHDEWITSIKWKPHANKDSKESIAAVALGDGVVQLKKIHNNGDMEILVTIIPSDYNATNLLEWSPLNDKGESYLYIGKGIGFYLYHYEKNQLSSLFIKHRATITDISFSDYYHFTTSSMDNNIIEFQIGEPFWNPQDGISSLENHLHIVTVNYLTKPHDEEGGLGINSVLTSPHRLLLIYTENLPAVGTMYSRHPSSRTKISYQLPLHDFKLFKESLYQQFLSVPSRQIWDYFMYINAYTPEEILEFIDELRPVGENQENNMNDEQVLKCKLIIKLFYILKRKSNGIVITEELKEKVKFYKQCIDNDYIYKCLVEFIKYSSDGFPPLLIDYQKVSLSLMVNHLKSIISTNDNNSTDYKTIHDQVVGLIRTDESTVHETCFYCSNKIEINESSLKSTYTECDGCFGVLERCSRSKLFISTPKTLNCDFCCSKSLVFKNEDLKEQPKSGQIIADREIFEISSFEYEFPWIQQQEIEQICIYCSTPLNGLVDISNNNSNDVLNFI